MLRVERTSDMADLRAGYFYMVRKISATQKVSVHNWIINVFLIICLIIAFYSNSESVKNFNLLLISAAVITFSTFLMLFPQRFIYHLWFRFWSAQKSTKKLLGPEALELSHDMVKVYSPMGNIEYNWSDFCDAEFSGDHLMIAMTNRRVMAIRRLPGEEELLQQVHDLVNECALVRE